MQKNHEAKRFVVFFCMFFYNNITIPLFFLSSDTILKTIINQTY